MRQFFEAKILDVRDLVSRYSAQMDERARLSRVTNHPHAPECTKSGDIVASEEIGELDHMMRVLTCTECGSATEFDVTQNFADNVGRYGLWH